MRDSSESLARIDSNGTKDVMQTRRKKFDASKSTQANRRKQIDASQNSSERRHVHTEETPSALRNDHDGAARNKRANI
jgi:hypothetical protein